LLIRH